MWVIYLILYVLGLGCFILAAMNRPSKPSLVPLGLAFWISVSLIELIRAHAGS